MSIELKPVTRANFDKIADLSLPAHQRGWVAGNSYSIAEAGFNPELRYLAIYAGDEPVGFVMYCLPEEKDEQPGQYGLWRFMIDGKHQQRGYGKAALELVVQLIWSDPEATRILVPYKAENAVARRLYESLGFNELGIDDEIGEMVAELRRRGSRPHRSLLSSGLEHP